MNKALEEMLNSIKEEIRDSGNTEQVEAKSLFRLLNYILPEPKKPASRH
jgi:hypothetical protein